MNLKKLSEAQLLELQEEVAQDLRAREHARRVEEDVRREKAKERAELGRQTGRERDEAAVLAAIALLEAERDTLRALEAKARNEEKQKLRVAIRQIEEGVSAGEGCEASVWAILTRPEIRRFPLVRPSIASLQRELARLRRGERKIGDPVEIYGD
jgi:hypothetical protein